MMPAEPHSIDLDCAHSIRQFLMDIIAHRFQNYCQKILWAEVPQGPKNEKDGGIEGKKLVNEGLPDNGLVREWTTNLRNCPNSSLCYRLLSTLVYRHSCKSCQSTASQKIEGFRAY